MKLVCISDTHNLHSKLELPDGEVLIHAGDSTMNGTFEEFLDFMEWFVSQPHKHKILIGGNHDFCLESEIFVRDNIPDEVHYLQDSSVTLDGVKFWGTPWCPNLERWAFFGNDNTLEHKASLIDLDTRVLISHSPPYGVTDSLLNGRHVGNKALTTKLLGEERCVELVICGHIHESYGGSFMGESGIYVYNTSVTDSNYVLSNRPVVTAATVPLTRIKGYRIT